MGWRWLKQRLLPGAALLVLGLGGWSCGVRDNSDPLPSITRFSAADKWVPVGEGTKLTAVFANGTGRIEPELGDVSSGVETATGGHPGTTTYTLTVTNPAGKTVRAQVVVSVGLRFILPDVSSPGTTASLMMNRIPTGSFQMGHHSGEEYTLPDEDPQHQVTIGGDFYMGAFEVTQAQWVAIMGSNPSHFSGDPNLPVESVSWDMIRQATSGFLAKLNEVTAAQRPAGLEFRLPSEAEWEYAIRAGTATRYYWGEDYRPLPAYAWSWNDAEETTHPVGWKLPNAYGLFDIAGNVCEWCEDDYQPSYTGAPADGSPWIHSPRGTYRSIRGGAFSDYHCQCYRSAFRGFNTPDLRSYDVGFRVVLGAPANP